MASPGDIDEFAAALNRERESALSELGLNAHSHTHAHGQRRGAAGASTDAEFADLLSAAKAARKRRPAAHAAAAPTPTGPLRRSARVMGLSMPGSLSEAALEAAGLTSVSLLTGADRRLALRASRPSGDAYLGADVEEKGDAGDAQEQPRGIADCDPAVALEMVNILRAATAAYVCACTGVCVCSTPPLMRLRPESVKAGKKEHVSAADAAPAASEDPAVSKEAPAVSADLHSPRRRSSRAAAVRANVALITSSPVSSPRARASTPARDAASAETRAEGSGCLAEPAPRETEAVQALGGGLIAPETEQLQGWPLRDGGRPASRLAALGLHSERHVMKVVPERIYSIAFHPSAHRLISITGDKSGRLGFWCPALAPSHQAGSDDVAPTQPSRGGRKRARGATTSECAGPHRPSVYEPAEDDEDVVAVFWPHRSPINHFQIPLAAPHTVVTCSYDGSIRSLDVNAGISWELFEGDEAGFSSMAVASAGPDAAQHSGSAFTLYAGTYHGQLLHIDTRVPRSWRPPYINAHDKKITAISCLPGRPYFLTSSGDKTVQIWDARKIAPHTETSGKRTHAWKSLMSLDHGASVTSAFFSAHGHNIVSTCNDNMLRVWQVLEASDNIVDSRPTAVVSHNNHTGRWLSAFRTVFDPANDGTFVIGNMDRHLEVYSITAGSAHAKRISARASEWLTAIPTLNAVHPHPEVDAITSGTASGRVYMWT